MIQHGSTELDLVAAAVTVEALFVSELRHLIHNKFIKIMFLVEGKGLSHYLL